MARALKEAVEHRAPAADRKKDVVVALYPDAHGYGYVSVREIGQPRGDAHAVTFGQLHTILAMREAERRRPRRRLRGF